MSDIKLVIGSSGQIGSVLTKELQLINGVGGVVAADLRINPEFNGVFEKLDATSFRQVKQIVDKHKVVEIYHLAAILSAKGENHPLKTWDVNMKSFFNILEVSRLTGVKKVFFPSSIAVFGNGVERKTARQSSSLSPTTVYGVSKAAGENWATYYSDKYGMDIRSLRFPGIVGYQSNPGGGTTDYAVDIFHHAIKGEAFKCFLEPDTTLPMIYMEDAIRATLELMEKPKEYLSIKSAYNLTAMSFSPKSLAKTISQTYPNFEIIYEPDFRQTIAEGWPREIDDSVARKDWGWEPSYDIQSMTETMILQLNKKYDSMQNSNKISI
ncbi:MAG: NAD-dependent epimerase/dehydratase family protein [Fulvivirga sp.]|uniref:NAD-dependent epimerase/dehydratase family protein n=1 Tax=Fulvivirga sp. TaxID=1931237 RepID=UPI0032EE843D